MFCRILHDEITQIVLRFMINHATPKIVSSRNSVRVVFLIARGWRGASLPRVNDRKEIQRRRCCVFDSPGLPNDSAGYPGLTYDLRGTTPSVLRFLSVIRYKSPRYTHVFTEKAQHLRR